MSGFEYEIIEEIAILSESKSGWTKEINKISFNGRPAKYDIRDWAPEHVKMGKGVTLNDMEADKLFEVLKDVFDADPFGADESDMGPIAIDGDVYKELSEGD